MSSLRAPIPRPSPKVGPLVKIGRFAAVRRYFRDKDASFFGKAFVVLAVFYVVMPFDLIPEAIVPVLGWLDDVGVVALALAHLARVTAKYRDDLAPALAA